LPLSEICTGGSNDAAREKLRAQSNEFRKEVIRVADGVSVAVGYSGSNVILKLAREIAEHAEPILPWRSLRALRLIQDAEKVRGADPLRESSLQ
jgi:hypothetical protein